MTDYNQLLNKSHTPEACSCFPSSILYLSPGRIINTTKIYIGYLPVTTTDTMLREVFQRHCQVSQVIIKKGNAQGHFDKFCYGFVTMNLPEPQALEVIARIGDEHPNWRLKIKEDGPSDQQRNQNKYQRQNYQPQQQYQQQQHGMYQMPQQMMTMPPPQQSSQSHQGHQGHQGHHRGGHGGHQMQGMQGMHQHHFDEQQPQQMHQRQAPSYNYAQQAQNDKGQIYGTKQHKIMVRELWLGGIPELIDHARMSNVMNQFGLVEATQIFPKFAFVKYKRAVDAAIAYERASRIHEIFGKNSGFRIAFSDPSRRKQIVGNNYQFQRNAPFLPILFLGFPPITSANVQINHMISVCQKFGAITNYYMKKSTNTQMRSYILFTYDSLKNALRAKQELCRRKDLLGEKRVEITLLLDEQAVLKGRDFTNTERNFINDQGGQQKPKKSMPSQKSQYGSNMQQGGYNPPYSQPQQQPQQQQRPMVPGNYPNIMMPGGQMQPPGYPYQPPSGQYGQLPPGGYGNMGYYYSPPAQYTNPVVSQQPVDKSFDKTSTDVFDLIQSVYDDPAEEKKKGPQKNASDKNENTTDIISKMLGKGTQQKKKGQEQQNEGQVHEDNDQQKEKQPDWAGFITWRGVRRVGVDGFAIKQSDFTDYIINVGSLLNNEDVILHDKANLMILEPSNSVHQPGFNDYLKAFRTRTGVSITKNWLIYLMGKNSVSESITPMKENQLLMVMEKPALSVQLKEKVYQCNDAYFQ